MFRRVFKIAIYFMSHPPYHVIVSKKIHKLLVFVSKRACLMQYYLIPNKLLYIVNEIIANESFSIFQ